MRQNKIFLRQFSFTIDVLQQRLGSSKSGGGRLWSSAYLIASERTLSWVSFSAKFLKTKPVKLRYFTTNPKTLLGWYAQEFNMIVDGLPWNPILWCLAWVLSLNVPGAPTFDPLPAPCSKFSASCSASQELRCLVLLCSGCPINPHCDWVCLMEVGLDLRHNLLFKMLLTGTMRCFFNLYLLIVGRYKSGFDPL